MIRQADILYRMDHYIMGYTKDHSTYHKFSNHSNSIARGNLAAVQRLLYSSLPYPI